MQLPSDMRFTELIHAADERVPVEGMRFGTDAVPDARSAMAANAGVRLTAPAVRRFPNF
jgi:hypothetical protein